MERYKIIPQKTKRFSWELFCALSLLAMSGSPQESIDFAGHGKNPHFVRTSQNQAPFTKGVNLRPFRARKCEERKGERPEHCEGEGFLIAWTR